MITNPETIEYQNRLLALATLGTPLIKVPPEVSIHLGLRHALQKLEIGLLSVRIEVMKAQLGKDFL